MIWWPFIENFWNLFAPDVLWGGQMRLPLWSDKPFFLPLLFLDFKKKLPSSFWNTASSFWKTYALCFCTLLVIINCHRTKVHACTEVCTCKKLNVFLMSCQLAPGCLKNSGYVHRLILSGYGKRERDVITWAQQRQGNMQILSGGWERSQPENMGRCPLCMQAIETNVLA